MRSLRIFLLSAPLFLPALVFAQTAPQNFQQLASQIIGLLNNATATLVGLGIVIYFGGIVTNLVKTEDTDREKMRTYILWGLVVIFIMVSIWAILTLLRDTLFGNSPLAPVTLTPSTSSFQAPTFQSE